MGMVQGEPGLLSALSSRTAGLEWRWQTELLLSPCLLPPNTHHFCFLLCVQEKKSQTRGRDGWCSSLDSHICYPRGFQSCLPMGSSKDSTGTTALLLFKLAGRRKKLVIWENMYCPSDALRCERIKVWELKACWSLASNRLHISISSTHDRKGFNPHFLGLQ